MGKTVDEVRAIKEDFKQEYGRPPYDAYVGPCGMTKLGAECAQADLHADESLDDLCLTIRLKKDAPADLGLPSEYQGLRVFYHTLQQYQRR